VSLFVFRSGESPSAELIATHRRANVFGLGLDWLNLVTLAHLQHGGSSYNLIERVAFRANFAVPRMLFRATSINSLVFDI